MKQLLKQRLVIEENMLAHRLVKSATGKRFFFRTKVFVVALECAVLRIFRKTIDLVIDFATIANSKNLDADHYFFFVHFMGGVTAWFVRNIVVGILSTNRLSN